MPSLKDVAREAGVSPSTVSAVINGQNCVKFSTRERVLDAIEKLGYTPNFSARELVTNKKQSIGFLMIPYENEETNLFRNSPNSLYDIAMQDYLNDIAQYFGNNHYSLLLERFPFFEDSPDLPKMVRQNRVNALFVVGSLYSRNLIVRLKEHVDVIVAVGCSVANTDYVCNNYAESVAEAIEYLIQRGHRRIAYVEGDIASEARPQKEFGYKLALQRNGIDYDPALVFQSKILVSAGYDVAQRIWSLQQHPTAIFFGSDAIAIGAYQFFYDHGVKIPEDVSVMGYENLIVSGFLQPPLTTVELYKKEMAYEACRVMMQNLNERSEKSVGVVVSTSIVERSSVKTL